MDLTKKKLDAAVEEAIITQEQADRLGAFLKASPSSGPRFDLTHVLYYMGGLIAIGAMTLFMSLGWERFGGWGIFLVSLLFAGIGLALTEHFQKRGHSIPAGIAATFVVALTPLAIYGLQQAMGWWPEEMAYRDYHRYIRWHWVLMELGTLAVGAIIAFVYRYPFLQMPIAVTLWYMSMDIAAMLTEGTADFEQRALVSMYFGLSMTLFAFRVDLRSSKGGDYAFWLYLFGVLTFWGGLTSQHADSELSRFLYLCLNLFMIAIGVIVVRRVFVVFGAIGTTLYLGHLADVVFKESWLFPIALTAIGLGIVYLGLLWQRKEEALTNRVRSLLPSALKAFFDARAV